jgi:threonine aldolase
MLAGTQADITRARLFRKRLGGAMRQAGASRRGLIALEDHPKNRRRIIAMRGTSPAQRDAGYRLDPQKVRTNIIISTPAAPA